MQSPAELKILLSHVLWIGGGTDAGKTTVTDLLAQRYGLQVYHYDYYDVAQTRKLAETMPSYQQVFTRSAEERWMGFTPEALMQRSLRHMADRFPLVLEELLALPKTPLIVAEGFGLTPNLIAPLIASPRQAIWLVPTAAFKWASMQRRGKPHFRHEVSDPALATQNFFKRDMLLSAHFRQAALASGFTVHEVDGSQSADEMRALLEQYFATFLSSSNR